MKIPVFHDDQHGTAIISGAALVNAAELQGKWLGRPENRLFRRRRGRDFMRPALYPARRETGEHSARRQCGVVYKGRTKGMNKYKEPFAAETRQAYAGRSNGRR